MVEITKQYEQLYGLKSENITNKRMADIIKKSELYKNLSKALGRYSLKLGKVDVEDIICVSYLENDRKRFKSQLPFLLDASVCVKIANPPVE